MGSPWVEREPVSVESIQLEASKAILPKGGGSCRRFQSKVGTMVLFLKTIFRKACLLYNIFNNLIICYPNTLKKILLCISRKYLKTSQTLSVN
jgi:hypothetical protein